VYAGAYLLGILVEGGHDVEAVELEFLVSHQGGAEVSDADEDRVPDGVPPEEMLDGGDERMGRVAFLGFPDDAGYGKILCGPG
jgi:hypothetical protein